MDSIGPRPAGSAVGVQARDQFIDPGEGEEEGRHRQDHVLIGVLKVMAQIRSVRRGSQSLPSGFLAL